MDVLEQPTEEAQAESADAAEGEQPQIQFVPVPMPYQIGAVTAPPQVPRGPDCPVVAVIAQGGWRVEIAISQNHALEFARQIKQAVKGSRSALIAAITPLLGANGQPISVPEALAEDDDDEVGE